MVKMKKRTIYIELIKECFDLFDKDHPFWRFAESPNYEDAKDTCPFISDILPEKEIDILIYVWHSLITKQEYDAGNAILFATQTGLLCNASIESIANYFFKNDVQFKSKIGKILFGAITRSIGLWCLLSGQKDVGNKLLRSGIEVTATMNYRKDYEIQKWRDFSEKYSIPIELKRLINQLT